MIRRVVGAVGLTASLVCAAPMPARAQSIAQRGFAEASGIFYPQGASGDMTRATGRLWLRNETTVSPSAWLRVVIGVDVRASSHDEVDTRRWFDWRDRGLQRPALSLRRAAVSLTRGAWQMEAGRQVVRWGKTDIVVPTDHFAPRDLLVVVDQQYLAVNGLRLSSQRGANSVEAVWVPVFTPGRLPLRTQRWSPVSASVPATLIDGEVSFPQRGQVGVRAGHNGSWYEATASYFDGTRTLPDVAFAPVGVMPGGTIPVVELTRRYPRIRATGVAVAVPTRWATVKAESTVTTSADGTGDDYLSYVVQAERQRGEWLFLGGYVGEAVFTSRSAVPFNPDRGLARSVLARASVTLGPTRSAVLEMAVRRNGRGYYGKGELSQGVGQHWRATASGVWIGGASDDFLGQYRRNSHATATLRYSF